ncbi:MAG: acetyl-CoA C-acetyltransferase [Solirubrobacterales bacterium]|nr:acetyl-CoA C-acetyltransferase [Solirubrobacterales bacterium]
MASKLPRPVWVIGGNRIPFVRSNAQYAKASNQDMFTAAVDGLVDRYDLAGERIGDFAGGAVLKFARELNLSREVVLSSKLAPETPAFDVGQACGTGLEAAILMANKIALGQIDSAIAGGTDTTSDAPIELNEDLRQVLMDVNRIKDPKKQALKLATSIRPGMIKPEIPVNREVRTGLGMGEHTALTAAEWGINREDQDELTYNSHQNLAKAWEEGWQDDLVTPYIGVEIDGNLRADTSLEKLASLKPVFGGKDGTMTAANSTPLSDGASAVLLGTEEWAKERGLPLRARFVDAETSAVDFVVKQEGLLLAPVYAVPRLLERNKLTLQDFDFYEIHEAFAAQVLATLKAWEDPAFCKNRLGLDAPLGSIDRAKLNVKGGSLAAAHPFAATGGRIVANLAKLLEEKGSGRGLISICAAGGQGIVAILER